jgi:hypothetical protein
LLNRRYEAIAEEEEGIDLGLLPHAAPMGNARQEDAVEPVVDFSSTLGPGMWQDQEFRKFQEQEANGKLTGGLGQGFQTDATISQSELLAARHVPEPSTLSRSLTLARRQPSLSRTATLRQLGQSAANRRGEVIEVVIEEEDEDSGPNNRSTMDLSLMSGPNSGFMNRPDMHQSTIPMKRQRTEVFYPQPDWKPFSMRWPYLLALISLSITLGGAQEVIYQMSAKQALLTFHSPSEIPPFTYFAIKFLPTLVAVSFGVLWQITDFEVKRLEAFFQMSKDGGALAAESINVDYITHFNFLRPFRALYCKHYAVAVSSVATLLANAAVPTLGANTIKLSPGRAERFANPLGEKIILIDPLWSRFLTAVLFTIAALGCILFYQLQSRKSGLLADVKGIAGLASMAVVSHILMDFKDMDVATHKDIHHKLKEHRYVLRNSSLAPDEDHPVSKQENDRYTTNHLSVNPHPRMLRMTGALSLIAGIAAFLGFLPAVLFAPVTFITDKAPWVITAIAVCIKLGWGSMETDIRMMEPYYILWRRHAPPRTLTLDYTALPFGWVAVRAMINRHWLVFFVGLGTVMAEFLTVLSTSLASVEGRDFIALIDDQPGMPPPNSNCTGPGAHSGNGCDIQDVNAGQETDISFWTTLGLALFILLYLGIVASVVLARRRRVFLPRQPNTIASVLAFIHQSKMLYDFVGTAKMSSSEVSKKLEELGKTYGLGWFQGRDGTAHCGVDEEELLSDYKHGYDYARATNPWTETVAEWL